MTRSFHIGHVVTVTTGRMITQDGVDGIYDILNFMTDDNLFTHVLPRAGKVCGPYLLGQFPQLQGVEASAPAEGAPASDWFAWRDALAAEHGEFFDVEPLPAGVWDSQDPIAELIAMVGPEKVIVVR
jgi:hypothetical protein